MTGRRQGRRLVAETPEERAERIRKISAGRQRQLAEAKAAAAAGVVRQRRALPQGRERRGDPPVPADARPPDDRDRLEAECQLRAGRSARSVAEEFGIRLGVVSAWAADLRERGQRR